MLGTGVCVGRGTQSLLLNIVKYHIYNGTYHVQDLSSQNYTISNSSLNDTAWVNLRESVIGLAFRGELTANRSGRQASSGGARGEREST